MKILRFIPLIMIFAPVLAQADLATLKGDAIADAEKAYATLRAEGQNLTKPFPIWPNATGKSVISSWMVSANAAAKNVPQESVVSYNAISQVDLMASVVAASSCKFYDASAAPAGGEQMSIVKDKGQSGGLVFVSCLSAKECKAVSLRPGEAKFCLDKNNQPKISGGLVDADLAKELSGHLDELNQPACKSGYAVTRFPLDSSQGEKSQHFLSNCRQFFDKQKDQAQKDQVGAQALSPFQTTPNYIVPGSLAPAEQPLVPNSGAIAAPIK